MKRLVIYTLLYTCVCMCAHARVENLPVTWSSHMVLQRGVAHPLSGMAYPGERVSVRLGDISCEVRADQAGRWQVLLPAMDAGGPYTLQVGDRTYDDVWVGEVWLCSGQSNMEFRLNQDADFRRSSAAKSDPNGPAPTSADGLRRSAADPRLHLMNMKARWLTTPARWSETACDSVDRFLYFDCSRGWQPCNEKEAAQFSAIAYYFGQMLADSLGVHIGLILNAVGGSTTESWIEEQTLREKQPEIFQDWSNNALVQDWVRLRGGQNVGSSPSGDVTSGRRHPYQPGYLYEAGIRPLREVPMAGAIWYQGESNAQDIKEHEFLFRTMVESWRGALTSASSPLPIYMVQLSSIAPRLTWPEFRNSQRRLAEEIPGVWMAISSDVGDSLDVHPRWKRPVGHRLAALALQNTYGRAISGLIPYSPTNYTRHKGRLYLRLGETTPRFTKSPRCMFEVRDADGRWTEARPSVEQGQIRLDFSPLLHPTAVRYGWQPFTRACVTSPTGWPLSTFMMELTH